MSRAHGLASRAAGKQLIACQMVAVAQQWWTVDADDEAPEGVSGLGAGSARKRSHACGSCHLQRLLLYLRRARYVHTLASIRPFETAAVEVLISQLSECGAPRRPVSSGISDCVRWPIIGRSHRAHFALMSKSLS